MIIAQSAKAGWALPEKIANSPSLLPGLELYYLAFLDLMSSRQIGMSVGPISWIVIEEFCVKNDLDEEHTAGMHYHIDKMDLVYLKHSAKKT